MQRVLLVERIHDSGIELLKKHVDIAFAQDTSKNTLKDIIADFDGIIIRSSRLDNEVISLGRKLKVIGRHGIGVDNIDVNFATNNGIAVVNTPNANVVSVAEHVITLMLTLAKKIILSDKALRAGEFSIAGSSLPNLCQSKGYSGVELNGKILGVIGFGKIGSLVAEKCIKGFNMKVLVYDPLLYMKIQLPEGASWVENKEQLLSQSDFISIHIPLTKNTKSFISKDELRIMKPTAFLINCARGGVVDEEALVNALKNGIINGAGIDVFENEPPDKNNKLFELPNVVLTPHAAAMTEESLKRMALEVVEGVLKVLEGKLPSNVVNPSFINYKRD